MHEMTGHVHIYTGDGKGKTTAAFGLALRAAGAGLRVLIVQFLKRGRFSEVVALESRFPEIEVRQYGTGSFITGDPSAGDIAMAQQGFAETRYAIMSGGYDVVIVDEGCVAASLGLIAVDDLTALIGSRPAHVELVFTGRNAPKELVARADLVTEMRAVKHYHDNDVKARRGIEH